MLGFGRGAGGGEARQLLAELGGDPHHVRGARSQLRAELGRRRRFGEAPENLHPRPEGWCSFALPGAPPNHAEAAASRDPAEPIGEAGLTDPRFAREEEERAAAALRFAESAS